MILFILDDFNYSLKFKKNILTNLQYLPIVTCFSQNLKFFLVIFLFLQSLVFIVNNSTNN